MSVYAFNSSTAVKVSEGTTTDTTKTTTTLDVDAAGSDVVTVQTAGEEKNTTDTAGTEAVTVQHAGSEALTVQHSGEEKNTTDTAGTEAVTVQHAGSEALTVQHSGEEKNTTDTAGTEAVTVQTAGSEVTGVTGYDTETVVYNNNAVNNRTVNMLDTGSDAHTGKDQTKDDLDIHAFGNIGTMSTQTMAEQELALRKADFVYNAILEFINLYTVYA